MMTNDLHQAYLGKLLANLHTLEFHLRAFFQNLPGARPLGVAEGTNIYLCPEGSELPENDFTNYESLGKLINRYNEWSATRGLLALGKDLVTLRDALAHGRVACPYRDDDAPFHLIKFSVPRNHRVVVEFNQRMTEQWYTENIELVQRAWRSVHETDAAQQGKSSPSARPRP